MSRSGRCGFAWRCATLAALLWCLSAGATEGDVGLPTSGRLGLESFGPEQGLSQSTVNALQGDDQGFLWVGTQEGLNRFDGHRFEIYRRGAPDAQGLLSSSIDALAFEHERQRLWLGTNDSGLEVIHLPSGERTRLGRAEGLSHTRVAQILPDPSGGAWVGTGGGVDRVDADLRRVTRLGASGDVVQLVAGTASGTALALDRGCRLWHATREGLDLLASAPDDAAGCVGLQLAPEGAWVATARQGLYLLDAADGKVRRHYRLAGLGTEKGAVGALLRMADGRILVGFGDGSIVQLGPGAHAPRPLPLAHAPESGVVALHQDRSGTLWIGTYTSGLYQVRPLSAAIRQDRAGAEDFSAWPSSSVRAIWGEGTHQLLGHDSGLMRRTGVGPWQPIQAFAGHTVRAIAQAPGGGWWIGTHGGLWRWDGADRRERVAGLPDPRIETLLVEGDATWVATRGGLARLERGQAIDSAALAPLHGRFLTALLRDRGGTLWISTNADGLWRLDGAGVLHRFQPRNGTLHESLWALHEAGNAIWAGSFSGGLFRIEPATGAVRAYTDRDGLFNNVVYRILEDGTGRLWLSTNNGLSVLDPASGIVQNLRPRDGLRNREFNSGSALRDADGLLYFGGTRGLDVIDPRGLPARSATARPVLTALRVMPRDPGVADERRLESNIVYADRIALDHADRVFSIEMTAIDFTAPDAARLRYRMLGLHHEWVQPQAPRAEFSVSHLPAGTYSLQVQAAGRDGQFGAPRTLLIDVAPPWWRHGLAYSVYALLALLLLAWLGSRIGATVRRERRRVELLNRTVAERTAQLQEANLRLRQTNEQLDVATRRDPLTRISNRRDLQDWLGRETTALRTQLEQAPDGHARLAFFMIDIDDFKQVNDIHGHQAGDEVLVHFADRLRLLCREQDLLVRWGGEEFLLISRFTRIDDAMLTAERIREAIARQPIRARPGVLLELTCSIGFAPWPFSLEWPTLGEWEDCVALADRCLYAAKRAGKHAWVGLAPGPSPDQAGIQALLAGAAPELPGPDCVQVLHSTPAPPRFER